MCGGEGGGLKKYELWGFFFARHAVLVLKYNQGNFLEPRHAQLNDTFLRWHSKLSTGVNEHA